MTAHDIRVTSDVGGTIVIECQTCRYLDLAREGEYTVAEVARIAAAHEAEAESKGTP